MKPELIIQDKRYNPVQHRNWYLRNAEKKKQYARVYYEAHKEERIEYAKERRLKNPRNWVSSHLRRLYGLTEEAVAKMRIGQNNMCALCGVVFDDAKKATKPHIDHSHETGKVRGLLCSGCNVSLGHIERPGFLEKAKKYLEPHEA